MGDTEFTSLILTGRLFAGAQDIGYSRTNFLGRGKETGYDKHYALPYVNDVTAILMLSKIYVNVYLYIKIFVIFYLKKELIRFIIYRQKVLLISDTNTVSNYLF